MAVSSTVSSYGVEVRPDFMNQANNEEVGFVRTLKVGL